MTMKPTEPSETEAPPGVETRGYSPLKPLVLSGPGYSTIKRSCKLQYEAGKVYRNYTWSNC